MPTNIQENIQPLLQRFFLSVNQNIGNLFLSWMENMNTTDKSEKELDSFKSCWKG